MLVAFGLGNPGDRYSGTRHNIGKEVVTSLIEKLHLSQLPGKGQFYYAHHLPKNLCLVVPTTYVNASGVSASQVVDEFRIGFESLLVICDDFSLPLGTIRIRKRGSDGGHNGLASVIFQLASEEFPRLRLGVGPLPANVDSAEFVLSTFEPAEEPVVRNLKETAGEAVLAIAADGIDRAMSGYNRRVDI